MFQVVCAISQCVCHMLYAVPWHLCSEWYALHESSQQGPSWQTTRLQMVSDTAMHKDRRLHRRQRTCELLATQARAALLRDAKGLYIETMVTGYGWRIEVTDGGGSGGYKVVSA
ncbi:hypothetical protein BC628DRAFT_745404 [Trametes gibbosa]|nr:hypothetical protein BC628DRAFT_745404 [Trametes gibbosa]